MRVGFEEPHLRVLDRGTDASPNLPHFCIFGSSGWASVMAFPWELSKA